MPSVTLTHVWVHDATDPTDYIRFDGGTEAVATAKPGENRRMANGRVRGVTTAGSDRSVQVEAPYIDQDDFDWLEAKVEAGTLLLLRDAKRRVRWGHIFGLAGPVSGAEEETVTFTFEATTHVEEV